MPHACRIGLATYASLPDLSFDDQRLRTALLALGADAEPVVWSSRETDWRRFDAVVVRSCWDYHLRLEEFIAWITELEAAGVRVLNPSPVLRWNLRKRYLRELRGRGVPMPSTLWLSGETPDLDALLAGLDGTRVVVKPEVSASAYETWSATLPLSEPDRERLLRALSRGDVLVQSFVEAIRSEGEHSFLFFEGAFSHAVRKRPAAGDFRVQQDHGGTAEPAFPEAALIEAAGRIAAMAPEPPLYARVDAVVAGSNLLLMELELVEPSLFLGFHEPAADQLARAILSRMEPGNLRPAQP